MLVLDVPLSLLSAVGCQKYWHSGYIDNDKAYQLLMSGLQLIEMKGSRTRTKSYTSGILR
jgi:hypothetical protein